MAICDGKHYTMMDDDAAPSTLFQVSDLVEFGRRFAGNLSLVKPSEHHAPGGVGLITVSECHSTVNAGLVIFPTQRLHGDIQIVPELIIDSRWQNRHRMLTTAHQYPASTFLDLGKRPPCWKSGGISIRCMMHSDAPRCGGSQPDLLPTTPQFWPSLACSCRLLGSHAGLWMASQNTSSRHPLNAYLLSSTGSRL